MIKFLEVINYKELKINIYIRTQALFIPSQDNLQVIYTLWVGQVNRFRFTSSTKGNWVVGNVIMLLRTA